MTLRNRFFSDNSVPGNSLGPGESGMINGCITHEYEVPNSPSVFGGHSFQMNSANSQSEVFFCCFSSRRSSSGLSFSTIGFRFSVHSFCSAAHKSSRCFCTAAVASSYQVPRGCERTPSCTARKYSWCALYISKVSDKKETKGCHTRWVIWQLERRGVQVL